YGLQFVSPHNILVTTISGIGVVIEGIYMVIFIIYAPKKNKLKSMVLLVVALIVSASVSKVSLLAIHEHETCFSEKLVIQTKTVEYMPFLLSMFVFLCGTSWFDCGLLGGDPFITSSQLVNYFTKLSFTYICTYFPSVNICRCDIGCCMIECASPKEAFANCNFKKYFFEWFGLFMKQLLTVVSKYSESTKIFAGLT
ncbi:hypothetical protein MKW92_013560, partial [Papaver armeniacum]